MPQNTSEPDIATLIAPLNMNGLQGRMLVAPPTKPRNREMLLVYGHHAKLERWWSLVQNLQEYGTVTMPDLPGFGGMESFYKIGKQPTVDNYADYLAAFIKMRYKKRRLTIIGISFGFVVATRMLQRYPELVGKVDMLVSMVGFMHHDDFLLQPRTRRIFRVCCRLFGTRPVAFMIRYGALNGPVIRNVYANMKSGKRRLSTMDPFEVTELMKVEVNLWQINDVSTHWRTTSEFLGIDNCKQQIGLPVWHVASANDHYLDAEITKQHMLIVFKSYTQMLIDTKAHTPHLTAGKKEMKVMIPPALHRELNRK